MNDDRYDDGLVHSHGWATEPPPTGVILHPDTLRPQGDTLPEATRPQPEDMRDDGLVHPHGWACGERGRPAGSR